MTEPGAGLSHARVVAGQAVWWPGVGDPRRWRPEMSTVAQARTVARRRGQLSGRRRGPEEVAALDIDGGPGKDGGPEVRTMVERRQDMGGQERCRWI
jgi:hypothetical protein